ncbi:triose-phosphate isomerase [Lutispora saccharofermentans]|uniref:triose-phosphate isomerase n=1 Tax=Lutispora saccharofermentans TaxID=3024236 RepID=UPI0020D1A193
MRRKPIIAGNWKMNNTMEEAEKLVAHLLGLIEKRDREVVICPSFVCLSRTAELLKDHDVALGAQNMHYEDNGAFTGEVSPLFLKEVGVTYVILGHSERRHIFGEKDDLINKKVKATLKHDMNPIVCVGETLEERESNVTFEIIKNQVYGSLAGLEKEKMGKLVIAYEPVWAIGTGKTATKEDANEVIGYIRKLLAEKFGKEAGDKTRILYGGSVKPANIKELMDMEEIDGALVGGASLKAVEFSEIANYDITE